MGEPRQRLVLGVDAGGTKTTALIAAYNGMAASTAEKIQFLGRGDGGPGSPIRHGVQAAFSNVVAAIQMAGAEASVPLGHLAGTVIGMAGAGTSAMQHEAVESIQRQTQLGNLRVMPDFQLVLPAAFPAGGVAVIAGTGSIVHGVRGANETRVGGHGYLVDDCGSGFWIGRQALRAMVCSIDGRGPKTTLTDMVCELFQDDDPANITASIHASSDRLSTIAAIAPLVVTAAVDGDAVSQAILDRAASELANMITTACQTLGYAQDDYSLAVAGSVLTKTDVAREKLMNALRREGIAPQTSQIVTEPVWGAIQLAAAC